jgi:hypothetical protein
MSRPAPKPRDVVVDLPAAAPSIVIKSADQLAAEIHTAVWLLEPYLEKNSSVLIFGDLGTFKSFLALHWSLEVALLGHQVLYLSAEGKGLGKRVKGWARDRFAEAWQKRLLQLPFMGIEQPLNLSADLIVGHLLNAMDDGAIEPALIVVDTISKNSDGRVEASTEEATAYLNRLDAELRDRFKACLMLVHHTGHMEKQRARGPYALMANTDSAFRIDRPDPDALTITVTAGRMKDCEPPAPFSLAARVVDIGDVDAKGKAITTLVLEPTETVIAPSKHRPKGGQQLLILNALETRQREAGKPILWSMEDLTPLLKDLGVKHRNSRRAAMIKLVEGGFLRSSGGCYSLIEGCT